MSTIDVSARRHNPWNKGKLSGQKALFQELLLSRLVALAGILDVRKAELRHGSHLCVWTSSCSKMRGTCSDFP